MAKKNFGVVALTEPIDLRYKCVKSFWRKRKIVPTSIREQKHLKKAVLKIFPDNLFYDDLKDDNSIDADGKEYSGNSCNKPINLRYKYRKNIFRKRVQKATTDSEQRKLKKAFVKLFPDALFYDRLYDSNSVKAVRTKEDKIAGKIAGKVALEYIKDMLDDHDCNEDNDCDECDSMDIFDVVDVDDIGDFDFDD